MIRLSVVNILLIMAMPLEAGRVDIIADGEPIIEPGIFVQQCIYGANASLSDHPPIIWPKLKIAAWNIANRVSHMPITKEWALFGA